jgi:O-antigen/teichoic acid export membrane protein
MTIGPEQPDEELKPESIQTEIGQIARGAGLGLGGNLFYYFINFLFGILVARRIGAEAFGIYTLGVTAVTLLARIAVMGLDRGSLRYVSINRKERNGEAMWQVIWTSVGLGMAASLLMAAALAFYPRFFLRLFHWHDKLDLLWLFPIFALALPAMTLAKIGISGTQAFRTVRYRALIPNFIQPSVKLLTTLALLTVLGYGALAPTLGFVLAQILGGALSIYFLWRLASAIARSRVRWEPGLMSELMRYSLPLLLSSVLMYLNGRTEIMVLGIYNQANASGIYNAALRLAGLSLLVLTAFNAIFAPLIADLHHRAQMKHLDALFKLVTRWVIIVAMPIFLVQMLFPHQLIGLFGKDFSSGALALRLLSIGTLINFCTGSVGIMLLMSGHSGVVMINSIITVAIALALDFMLIRFFGITGAAIAGMISAALINLINLGEVWYLLRIHPYNRRTLRPFIAAMPALAGGWLWARWMPVQGVMGLMIASAVVGLIYLIGLQILGWSEDDRMMMAALKKRFLRLAGR